MKSEVLDLVAALQAGDMSLDQVAQRFRERAWSQTAPQPSHSYLDLAKRAEEDPGTYLPGSFDDVAAAFHRGDLTQDQYRVLAEAAAESMRRNADQNP
jgi:hypothetical protein